MKDTELTSFEGKQTIFEQIKEVDENGNEYWTARKLSEILDYSDQNHGYMGLYGGLDAKGIHKMKALKKNEQILDHMGSAELAANLLRATQTEIKLRQENIQGKNNANKTHFEVGKKVRKTIQELGNPMPETLPTEESIKNLEKEKNKQNKAKLKTGKSNELLFDDET